MRVAKLQTSHKLVACLVLVAVVVCAAGMRHQSMQQRISKEQNNTGLRQQ